MLFYSPLLSEPLRHSFEIVVERYTRHWPSDEKTCVSDISYSPAHPFSCMRTRVTCAGRAQNPRGALRGAVEDSSGTRVAAAIITVTNLEFSLARQTRSDARGEFRVEELPPGKYRVTVSAPGFSEATSEIVVAVSSVREIRVTLRPKSFAEKVFVNAASQSITTEPLETASAVHQAVAYRQDLESIPLAARSFANIAYLTPGTEPVEPSDPTKARITAVATGGSSGLNNEVSVDGGDNSDDYIGGFLQNFSPDAIQEFAFRTAQAEPIRAAQRQDPCHHDAEWGQHVARRTCILRARRGPQRAIPDR